MNDQNHHNLPDRDLIEKVLAGDAGAFGLIIKNTEALVAQVIYKMISNKEDRKDIAQEVYMKAYKNLPGFRFESKLSTWIARIAYNTCLNQLEKKKLLLLDDIELPEKLVNHTAALELDMKERSVIISAAIEKLPPILKTLITLYHNENLSYAEIQQITELPEGTIKSYLFRARKALKENLLQHYKKDEI
ncbi:MAG TPA: sigma-70 family RNA polymerase sigma factor [Chitinophagaceae bacterium]|nr:sigma-70 family RNA polymerase sigma factor [Chitinophagaceae bacterium]